jgi:hypothetical protein
MKKLINGHLLKSASSQNLKSQFRFLLVALIISLSFFAGLLLLGSLNGLSPYFLVSDLGEITSSSPLAGSIANLSASFFAIAGAICMTFASLCRLDAKISRQWFQFFLLSGLLSFILFLDDLLQIHESIGSAIAFLNPSGYNTNNILLYALEKAKREVVTVTYAIFIVAYLVKFRMHFRRTKVIFLYVALSCFALSVIMDVIPDNAFSGKFIFEEFPKFFGTIIWALYFYVSGIDIIRDHLNQQHNGESILTLSDNEKSLQMRDVR